MSDNAAGRRSILDRFRLDGRAAIVTGGNRGIGRGIAAGLLDAGADVVVANRNEESGRAAVDALADRADDQQVLWVPLDVTDEGSVAALVSETTDRLTTPDVLVNNAGITHNVPAEEMSHGAWRRVLDVNLTGVFRCSKHVGRAMIEGEGGSIVTVSSVSAFVANHPQPQVAYNASKAGVEGLTKQLAAEWAEHGIRVNNLNPGYVRTDMIDELLETDPEMGDVWFDEMLHEEMADPLDVAALAVFLAADASAYMTGESVVFDGGYTVR